MHPVVLWAKRSEQDPDRKMLFARREIYRWEDRINRISQRPKLSP